MTSSRPAGPWPSRTGDRPQVYTIHVGAVLGSHWVEWFDGESIVGEGDGTSSIIVEVSDQAMLFGLLLRVHDLGLPLIGVYPGRGAV